MPTYLYDCECGHTTERRASVSAEVQVCPECGGIAQRRPFYSGYAIHVVGGTIPPAGTEDRHEADRKALKKRGWDYERAVEHVRSHLVETDTGKVLDTVGANSEL
jgi:putative FmdB family regulatory protein